MFKGLIADEHVKQLIMNGLLDHVSIGASVKNLRTEETENGEDIMVAEGIEFLELSVTPVTGVPEPSIGAGEGHVVMLAEKFKEMKMMKQDQIQTEMNREVERKMVDELKIAKETLIEAIRAFDES